MKQPRRDQPFEVERRVYPLRVVDVTLDDRESPYDADLASAAESARELRGALRRLTNEIAGLTDAIERTMRLVEEG